MSSQLHELYDISVLFDSKLAAKSAWTRTTKATSAETNISEGQLSGLGWFRGEAMPRDILDLRLVGDSFTTGGAYVALKLGIIGQEKVRVMLTNPKTGESAYPDPWKENALQRVASQLIEKLLAAGGKAVVLHKANALVKSAAQFRAELGDLSNPDQRPFRAWIGVPALYDDNGGVYARSYGLFYYFGAPEVHAPAPSTDQAAIETAVQAVLCACERIAGNNEDPFSLGTVSVPAFQVGEHQYPAIDLVSWFSEHDYIIELLPPGVTPPPKGGVLRKLFGK